MDIVEQCRKAKEYSIFDSDVYEQAADEIERLRKDRKILRGQFAALRQSLDWCVTQFIGINFQLSKDDK